MTFSNRGDSGELAAAIRAALDFVLGVTLLGPVAYVAALAKQPAGAPGLGALGHHYVVVLAHFGGFSALAAVGLLLYRHGWPCLRAGVRRGIAIGSSSALAAATVATLVIVGPSQTLAALRHVLDDAIIFTVVLAVERLHHQLFTTRLQAQRRQLRQERERRATAEARWYSLESRLRPHFLFNTLSSIRELMYRDAREAGAMVQRFADLLRFSLDSDRCASVPLREEMRITGEYLEIERMRLGRRLQWTASIDPACQECSVPALSVLTLVENAVKHAVAPRREGGTVSVIAKLQNGALLVEVADDGPGFTGNAIVAGHGIDLLMQLLETRGAGEELSIRPGAQGAAVTLTLPVSAALAAGGGAA